VHLRSEVVSRATYEERMKTVVQAVLVERAAR
jgi:hypothetical protein